MKRADAKLLANRRKSLCIGPAVIRNRRSHKGIFQHFLYGVRCMIGTVINQLFKLKNIGFRKKVPGVHIIF